MKTFEGIEGLLSKQGQLLGFSNLHHGRFNFWLLHIWLAIEINSKVHHTYNNNMKYQKTVLLNQVVMTIYQNRQGSSKARFRRRTFQEPNLIYRNKYMKRSASESIRNACGNLKRLRRSFRPAQPGISPLEWLWKGFDSDAELFMYRTLCINYYNEFCKQFDRNEHFSPFELSSAAIKIGVWINLAGLNNLGRP